MTNSEKLNLIIGKILNQVDELVTKNETPNYETLEALKILVSFTGSAYQINGDSLKD
ncbi:MAG TPA: hypothetical protein VN456_12175 [Desulfosporosinus sp.]|nr:hypothetical protein [Desulfosporosinus sp.]